MTTVPSLDIRGSRPITYMMDLRKDSVSSIWGGGILRHYRDAIEFYPKPM